MLDKILPPRPVLLLLLIPLCLGGAAIAAPLDARDDVVYTEQETRGAGWANVSPATQGAYVHQPHASHESERTTEVYMVGKASRQDFDYLTAEEQEGIWQYRQKIREERLGAMRIAALPPAQTKVAHERSMLSGLQWPRVIVDGSAVCVPKLEYSEATDWGDHLVCTDVGFQHD